jgi:hypothetical protein
VILVGELATSAPVFSICSRSGQPVGLSLASRRCRDYDGAKVELAKTSGMQIVIVRQRTIGIQGRCGRFCYFGLLIFKLKA